MFRALPVVLLALLVHACTSPSSQSDGPSSSTDVEPGRLTLIVYRDGLRLSLVNQAHGDLVEFNSEVREDANTKVTYNELVEGVIGYYADNGFYEMAVRGRAPLENRDGSGQAIEVETPKGTYFVMPDPGMSLEDAKQFHEFRQVFIEAYNYSPQAQSVVNPDGKMIFKQPEPSDKNRR